MLLSMISGGSQASRHRSCDIEAQYNFVPDVHTHAFVGPEPTKPEIAYKLPTFSVFTWVVSVVPRERPIVTG